MLAVRTIGTIGRTREVRAETHPVSASAASTTTKVTSALDPPGINTIANHGSTATCGSRLGKGRTHGQHLSALCCWQQAGTWRGRPPLPPGS